MKITCTKLPERPRLTLLEHCKANDWNLHFVETQKNPPLWTLTTAKANGVLEIVEVVKDYCSPEAAAQTMCLRLTNPSVEVYLNMENVLAIENATQ